MSLTIEIIGSIHHVGDTVQVTDTFSKREFVVHIEDEKNPKYDDYIQLQTVQDNCDKLDGLHFKDKVKVQVNVRGREYERKDGSGKAYFNSLDAWKIEVMEHAQSAMPSYNTPPPAVQQPTPPLPEEENQDLPF